MLETARKLTFLFFIDGNLHIVDKILSGKSSVICILDLRVSRTSQSHFIFWRSPADYILWMTFDHRMATDWWTSAYFCWAGITEKVYCQKQERLYLGCSPTMSNEWYENGGYHSAEVEAGVGGAFQSQLGQPHEAKSCGKLILQVHAPDIL